MAPRLLTWQVENRVINITSHDMAQHRADRMRKTLRVAASIAGLTPGQTDLLIHSLHDERGTLVVTWHIEPSEHQRRAFADAWALYGEDRISHQVFGGEA
jgi:hypothetical protein